MNRRKGFTLIELLVVVAIITLLASIVITATNIARAKGNDARKMVEMNSIKGAITSYYNDHGSMPPMYTCTSSDVLSCTQDSNRATLEIQDTASARTADGAAFRATMNQMVAENYLTSVPEAPGPNPYMYFDYGPGSNAGVLFGTILEASHPTATPIGSSCRPNSQGVRGSGGGVLFDAPTVNFTYRRDSGGFVVVEGGGTIQKQYGDSLMYDATVSSPAMTLNDVVIQYYFDGSLVHTTSIGTLSQFSSYSDTYNVSPPTFGTHSARVDVTSSGGSVSATTEVDFGRLNSDVNNQNLCDDNVTNDYCVCNPY